MQGGPDAKVQGGDCIRRLDLTGRKWPGPVIEVAKAVKRAQPGEKVEVLLDDLQGNRIVSEERVGSTWRVVIEKGD